MKNQNEKTPPQPSLLENLRDPIWQFIGASIAIIGIFIAIFLPGLSQQKREVSVKIIFSSILSENNTFSDSGLKILFNSKEVNGVFLSEIILKNTGNATILPVDYINPIRLELRNCNVLTEKIISSNPDWLKQSLKIEKISRSKIEFTPFLFNPGESFIIRVLSSDCSPNYSFTSRIVGIRQLNIVNNLSSLAWIGWLSIPLLLFLLFSVAYSGSGKSTEIASRLSKLRGLKFETEKRYLFEPERSNRLSIINKEMDSVGDEYKKSDKSRQRLGNLISILIIIALAVIFFISNQVLVF